MRIRSGKVELRGFEPALSDDLYAVRNHPSVRRDLRDARPLERASHDRWVRENLIETRSQETFLVFDGGAARGLALLRGFRAREAEIGVMIVEPERHRLLAYVAAHLVGYYAFEVLDLARLLSKVPLRHEKALEFNRACGFEPTGEASDQYHVLALTQARSREHPAHKRFRETRAIEVDL